jgi:hypothetical protein
MMSVLTELLKTFRANTPIEYSASTPKIFDFFDHGPAIIVTKDQKEILATLYKELQQLDNPDDEYLPLDEIEEVKVLEAKDDTELRKEIREKVFTAFLHACVASGFMGDQVIILEKVIHDFTIKTQDSLLMENAELVSIGESPDMQAVSEIMRLAGKHDEALSRQAVKYLFECSQEALTNKDKDTFENCINVLLCLGDMSIDHWNKIILETFHLNKKRNRVISDNYLIQPAKDVNSDVLMMTEKEIKTRFQHLVKAVKVEEAHTHKTPRRASGI